jgi:beta-lactamase superfamily II metal-dependent hydrolase
VNMARSAKTQGPRPIKATVRMYQVGFGDCFLLSFGYERALPDGRRERHVLIDFGTKRLPESPRNLATIAESIHERTRGEIDVLVVTHRHQDHLSAFGLQGIPELLCARGYPKLVVRSWTENPAAEAAATGGGRGGSNDKQVAERSLNLLAALQPATAFADTLARRLDGVTDQSLAGRLKRLAADQLPNKAAIDQLTRWADEGRGVYLRYGMRSGIEDVVPGINVRVLGPPTVDQHKEILQQREVDESEFWMLYGRLARRLSIDDLLQRSGKALEEIEDSGAVEGIDAAPGSPEEEAPPSPRAVGPIGPVRWLTDRMGRQQLNSLLRIVRSMDDILNNTSVILLFELRQGRRPLRLLFPGDAQIENWEYALRYAREAKDNLELLRTVDLYKVGHHGSRNATPKTLYNLWNEPRTKDRKMWALLSTKPGVYGKTPATAVPRSTLVSALRARMTLLSTEPLKSEQPYEELTANLRSGSGFLRSRRKATSSPSASKKKGKGKP